MRLVGGLREPLLDQSSSVAVTYESESSTLFAAFTSDPGTTRKNVINTCIKSLKDNSIWTKIDVMFVLAAHDSQAASLNWKAPASYALTANNSPTFTTDRGYTGNSSNMNLSSTFNPNTNGVQYTQNDCHIACWDRSTGAEAAYTTGFSDVRCHLIPRHSSDDKFYARLNSTAGDTGYTHSASAGMYLGTRSDSSTCRGWLNGSECTGSPVTNTSNPVPGNVVKILVAESSFYSGHQIAMVSYGANLSSTNVSNFYSAISTYMTAIGA